MRSERGMSLVELLVAFAVLSSVAVLSAQLVIQSTRLMDRVAKSSRNPDLVIATEWIRRDLYEATSVAIGGLGWTDGPLLIHTQTGGWIAMGVVDRELVRTEAQPGGLISDGRVILRGVEGWRWRVDDGAVVQIEVVALANPEAYRDLTGIGVHRLERRTERMTMALRGKPGGGAW